MASIDSQSAGSTSAERDISSLTFRVERLEETHLSRVVQFSQRYFERPTTEAFYRWRYVESLPFAISFLAVTDTECLGLICALQKQFFLAGELTPVLEIFDWHSLPGLKGSGVGIRVMRALMRQGVRLLGIGGTPDVLRTLPAMGWQTIGLSTTYELPLAGEFLAGSLPAGIPGKGFALNALTAAWFRPRLRAFAGQAVQVARVGEEVSALYQEPTHYALLQRPSLPILDWTASRYPGAGGYTHWYFTVAGRLAGWASTRVCETERGPEAAIVDIFAPSPTVQLYAWMLSEVSCAVAGTRARVIRVRATCELLQQALRLNRFRPGDVAPVHTWPKMPEPSGPLHITFNHGDAPFRPYPTHLAATNFLTADRVNTPSRE